MPTLTETQLRFRRAVVEGATKDVLPLLFGGRDVEARLGIHRRNYEASLVSALLARFPGTLWLAGSTFITESARQFVKESPPNAPCIAEYGEQFPRFLSARRESERFPYIGEFAELEWHVGRVSIEIDQPPVSLDEFSTIPTEVLPDLTLVLQGGAHLHSRWPIDELLKLYVTEEAPELFVLEPSDVWLEIRGARGEFQVNRLDRAEFIFRNSISQGRSIGKSAVHALEADAEFDPGKALAALVASNLVVAIR